MHITEFDNLIGQNSYVRCVGKERIDPDIVDLTAAKQHLYAGGTIGWWVKPNYIVVDIDEGKKEALSIIKELQLKTLMCKTPRGVHLYFKNNTDYPQKINMVLPFGLKCDFRCPNKGYVILPYNLEKRSFNKEKHIEKMELEFTPLFRKESLFKLKEGDGRNSALFSHLMVYKNNGASEEQIEQIADIINRIVFSQPMIEKELNNIIQSTKKYEAKKGGSNPYLIYNEKGTPTQVNYRAINDYFVNRGDIFVLGGECYKYINGVYKESSLSIKNDIRELISSDKLLTPVRINEAYKLVLEDVRIQKDSSNINNDKTLINFSNGVWSINTKELLNHDTKYLHTVQIPQKVLTTETELENTMIYKFFVEYLELKGEKLSMLLDYMAYCLTMDCSLKCFMILYGPSNTGKSVLVKIFNSLVGEDNTAGLDLHEINKRFYPSLLFNRLLNSCADISSLALKSIDNLKRITGGDTIMHEKKGKEPFFFSPFCKLLFSCNQLPIQLEEQSNAFYNRMRVLYLGKPLELKHSYVEELCSSVKDIIPHLLTRLPLRKIAAAKSSTKIVQSLWKRSDTVHAFLKELNTDSKFKMCPKEVLYQKYTQYCINSLREQPLKFRDFDSNMNTKGFRTVRHHKSRKQYYKGVCLDE